MKNVDHDALEELLRQASPRPAPSHEDEIAVRAAVQAEWRDLTSSRRTRRRFLLYGIAATVLISAIAVLGILRSPVVDPVQVAIIEKSIGPVYVLGEQAVLRKTGDLSNIVSGQTIVTGEGAGLALEWGQGGSVRIDENSRVEFTDGQVVYLEKGRVYFDSRSSTLIAGTDHASVFILKTPIGEIRHVGTQYMTEVNGDALVVSVREGEVSVDGIRHDRAVRSGQQMRMSGSQQPSVLSIGRSGEAWNWVNRITPPVNVEGRSVYEFLVWASREMGLELVLTDAANSVARDALLMGTINTSPAEALPLRLATAAMDWRIDEGVIYISMHR